MIDTDHTLQALHDDLEALRAAVEQEDHAEAERIASGHDRRLREFVDACGVQAAANGLRNLLALQQSLMADMLVRRDIAAARLRAGRQSVRAVHAYQQAESLA
ncbi:hypothetical protein CQ393_02645 [Stenotrophomonas sp. MYb238]|uniref:hypothetical protein n=1 Tax=Stenotrophomonas sp. MYb238 TaxID=2040281 RepID=UPI0012918263|nr:hypothetical protein [Stenotrophomonas sp. MYb238]MQP74792.1 hypothetical protein [Stenotrophomonas sp. MYb238]